MSAEPNTFAHPSSDGPTPLGRDAKVEFQFGSARDYLTAYIEDGALRLGGSGRIVIEPTASNVVRVRLAREEPWGRWATFCDAAMVAPDTLLSPEELAARYETETGRAMDPEQVRQMMPENAR